MTSSTLPLSLLAKGIGQVVTNGHEKLEVYLEPEDYYNLKSYSPYHFARLQDNGRGIDARDNFTKPVPLHKTFVTRKGALLIFSEELANKAIAEEERRLKLKNAERAYQRVQHAEELEDAESEKGSEDPLRTVHDLRLAILMYGNRPDYRKKGDDLYLRFVHEARAPKDERKIRPGFSPKRYITAWSRHWHEEMLQKLRTTGLVQDKTLYRQNPLLPHLYQPASYNLSAVPPPYRVTKNMLRAGDIGTYDYLRSRRPQPAELTAYDRSKDKPTPKSEFSHVRREPPPSLSNSQLVKDDRTQEPLPIGSIQAVRFLESGEVEEVKYSELKPQEKQEILAELLATAWEHGKHIEEMLDLVLASNKPRSQSAASSSAASELMMDMHRAILSLAESPIQRQIQEKQQQLQKEKDKQRKKQEREEARQERKRQRRKKREEQVAKDTAAREKELEMAKKNAENEEQLRVSEKQKKQGELKQQAELVERQKMDEAEEKEKRRQARREARKKKEEEKAARKREKEERARQQEELARKQQDEEERLIMEEKREREERREERRRQRAERKQRQKEEEHARLAAEQQKQASQSRSHASRDEEQPRRPKEEEGMVSDAPVVSVGRDEDNGVNAIPSGGYDEEISLGSKGVPVEYVSSVPAEHGSIIPKSRPMPSVPQNTPATQQQRTARLQRQLPLENVIYEAKSKRSHASSSTTTSSKSRNRRVVHPPGTIVSSGDGEFATYKKPQRTIVQQQSKQQSKQKVPPVRHTQTMAHEHAKSNDSSHSSKRNAVFPADLPGDAASSHGKSSFYGGAMPISSNIVKTTLSDKLSILSASQEYSASGSTHAKSVSERSGPPPVMPEHYHDVPVIGVEPPTPILASSASKQPGQTAFLPSPIPSASSSVRSAKLRKVPEKGSSTEFSNESDDEPYLSDQSSRSMPKSQRDDAGVVFTKKSSTTLSGGSSSAVKYTLKGMKGPGSQSSAATLSQKTGTKKSSSSVTRGSVPYALVKHKKAAVVMPDERILDVGPQQEPSSITDKSTLEEEETEESVSAPTEPPKLSTTKSSMKNVSIPASSVKSERRVSFQEEREETSSEEDEEEEESESEEETDKEEADWPQVKPDDDQSRPISSRSSKLTEHAQKVAKIVVSKQRPGSSLQDDASVAAKVWNKVAKSGEGSTSEDVESEEESEEEDEDEEESSAGWNAGQVQEEEIIKKAEEEERKEQEKEKAVKKKAEKAEPKEIAARKQTGPTADPSVKSTSSGRTSVSSIQEAFVKEVKRKASELGIDEKELQFEGDLVKKVFDSTVDPNEVEVFHDIGAGKHVVRSRHSSITTKSVKTDTTESSASEETKAKQKYVIDMPVQEATSASPHRSVSSVTSTTASPTSPSRFRALSQSSSVHSRSRKSSIPAGEKDVSLEYQVTSYEGKLGDPKPEEPPLVMRQKVEPEKLDKPDAAQKDIKVSKRAAKDELKAKEGDQRAKEKKSLKAKAGLGDQEKETTSSTRSGATTIKTEKTATKPGKKALKKGKDKAAAMAAAKKQTEETPATASPEKQKPKTPEVPFTAGRAKEEKAPKGLQSPESSTTPKPKKSKSKPTEPSTKKEPKTQVEMEDKETVKGKVSEPKITSKESEKKVKKEKQPATEKTKTPESVKAPSPTKESAPRTESETPHSDLDQLTPIPAASPEDDYAFVRVEDSPAPSEPEPPVVEPEPVLEDTKSQTSDHPTEATEKTDNTEDLLRAQEEEEAKLAKKREKDERRLAAAEKRRMEVERKRKEKEEQLKREKEELERQDALKEELEKERRRRMEEIQRKKEEAQNERLREQQEEELRRKREEQQREREIRLQEEHKKKMEELQKRKREEEARKAELARIKAEEEERARKEEEELMAQMAEDERAEYERRKQEEAEAKRILEEERRLREEEEARIVMEQARLQAIIRAKQQSALEEKLKFAREFFIEANGMDQTQNVNRAFAFSYFELLQLLGLEITAETMEL